MALSDFTEDQVKEMAEEVRDIWHDRAFNPKPIDMQAAKKGVRWLYEYCDREAPEVFFAANPQDAQTLANMLAKNPGDKSEWYQFSYYGNISDYHWVAFYEFWTKIGELDFEPFNKFREMMESGLYDMIQFPNVAIVVPLYDKVYVHPESGRLHKTDGPAIYWGDWKLYFWNGTKIPMEWIEFPEESITWQTVVGEENAELRRIMYEILGPDNFASLCDLEQIDHKIVNHQEYTLLRSKHQIEGENVYFVKVMCPSSHRVYHICVDKDWTVDEDGQVNAHEAVARTFGQTAKTYFPQKET